MKFKVGDRVQSKQPDHEYRGVVKRIHPGFINVQRFDKSTTDPLWSCKRVGGKVATSLGVWDRKSYLIKLDKCKDINPKLFKI